MKGRKIEFGLKGISYRAISDYQSLIKYNPLDDYKLNAINTDYFNYNQNVSSAYSTFAFKHKKFNFRMGLRMEHTDLTGNFEKSIAKVDQHYTNLLPNIVVSTKTKKGHTVSLTYNLRLARPYSWNLNPFVNKIR